MKKIDLGQTISIFANIGVIAGIIFLAVEIRESRQQASVSNSLQAITEIAGLMRSVSEDEGQADLFQRGARGFSTLSESEQFRFDLLMRSFVQQLGAAQLARERGLTAGNAQGDSRLIEGTFLRLFDEPGIREWWEGADRRGIPTPLVNALDEFAENAR